MRSMYSAAADVIADCMPMIVILADAMMPLRLSSQGARKVPSAPDTAKAPRQPPMATSGTPEFFSRPSNIAPGVTTARDLRVSFKRAKGGQRWQRGGGTVTVQEHVAAGQQKHGLFDIDAPAHHVSAPKLEHVMTWREVEAPRQLLITPGEEQLLRRVRRAMGAVVDVPML